MSAFRQASSAESTSPVQCAAGRTAPDAGQAVVADNVVGASKAYSEAANEANSPTLIEARDASGDPLQGAFKKDREAVPVTRR